MSKKKHKCPVCEQYEFSETGSFDYCPVCGWCDDLVQEDEPDEENCSNVMSLNQARVAYKEGKEVY